MTMAMAPVDVAQVLDTLVGKLAELIEIPRDEVDPTEPLIDIGADSLVLMEAISFLEETYDVRLRARQILEELTTLELLADHIAGRPPVAGAGTQPEDGAPESSAAPDPGPPPGPPPARPATEVAGGDRDRDRDQEDEVPPEPEAFTSWMAPSAAAAAVPTSSDPSPELVAAFGRRLAGSKRHADRYRATHSDPRSVAGFRRPIKEVVVPLVASRAQGSRLWDVDGNEYLDMAMGFGSLLFGHGHPPIQRAIERQLRSLWGVGPVSYLAGPLSEEICGLTGHDRATFVGTGTEAIMLAVRLARATTGRRRVATFRGSYHGWWDGSLAVPGSGPGAAAPAVDGVIGDPPDDLLLLPWDDPASLDIVAAHADELAAIVVEPVQSRRPECQPAALLADLRTLATRHGIALIFDEMITGLRLARGGAAEVFGVQPDLATYGKALGGGLPIGCVAGASAMFDALDGGLWRYGDASEPLLPATFGAGTFSKHPLSMAASWAVLQEVERLGPELHEQLERRSARLQAEVNEVLRRRGLTAELARCGSLMRFVSRRNLDAFFAALISRGCYLWEGRTMFLSTAHDDGDVDRFVECCDLAARDLGMGGPTTAPAPPPGPATPAAPPDRPSAVPVAELPLTPNQQQLSFVYRSGSEVAEGFHNVAVLDFQGQVDADALRAAIATVVDRHESFRTTFDLERAVGIVWSRSSVVLEESWPDGDLSVAEREEWTASAVERGCSERFDLERGPLWRLHIVHETPTSSKMVAACSDLVADGISLGIVLSELVQIYEGIHTGEAPDLAEPGTLRAVQAWLESDEFRAQEADAVAYWAEELQGVDLAPPLPPTSTSVRSGYRMTRARRVLPASEMEALDAFGRSLRVTRVSVLLGAFVALVHRVGGRDDFLVGLPTAGRTSNRVRNVVASLATPVAIRVQLDRDMTVGSLIPYVQRKLFDALDRAIPIDELARRHARSSGVLQPLTAVMFNLDPIQSVPDLSDGVRLRIGLPERTFGLLPFSAALCPVNDGGVNVSFDAAASMYDGPMVEAWADYYLGILGRFPALGDHPLRSIPLGGAS